MNNLLQVSENTSAFVGPARLGAFGVSRRGGGMLALQRSLRRCAALWVLLGTLGALSGAAQAAVIAKADNAVALNNGASWVGGVVPTGADVALFDSTITTPLTVSQGGSLTFGSVQVTNPGGAVTINQANSTLTLQTAGLDLSSATADLTVNGGFIRVASANFNTPFTVAAGRTLTIGSQLTNQGNTKTLLFGGAGSIVLNGVSGAGGATNFNVTGANLVLNNPVNSFTFGTVTSGSLTLGNSTALQGQTVTNNAASGLQFGTGITSATLGGLAGSGAFALTNTDAAAVALSVGGNNAAVTYSGILSGAGSLLKSGTNTQTLTGQSTFTGGVTINTGGGISVSNVSGGTVSGPLGIGTLAFNGGFLTIGNGSSATTISNPIAVGGTGGTIFTAGTAATQSVTGAFSGSGQLFLGIGPQLSFNGGAGQLTNFSGTLNFGASAGTVRFQGTGAANGGTNGQNTAFDLGTATAGLVTRDSATIRLGSLSGLGTGTRVNGASNDGGITTYEIGGKGLSTTFAGVVGNGTFATAVAATALNKVGAGSLTLSGNNSYTGATIVSAGTLAIGAADRINDASNLTLGGGTFATGGFGETLNTLAASGNSNLDLGAGASILTFTGGISALNGQVNVLNYTGSTAGGGTDRIFLTNTQIYSEAQLAQIRFVNPGITIGTFPATQLSSGEIVPLLPAVAETGAIISEFRFRGKSGALDEYVELYNKRGGPLNISGWSIQTRTATGLQTTLVPDGKIIPPFGRYLFTGSVFSLTSYGTSDQTIAADILDASGVALFNAAGAVQDAVGFTTSDAALKEGAGLPSAPTSNGEYAFVRDTTGTLPKDTSDSTNDFVFVIADADATTPAALATVSGTGGNVIGRLGAPSPEGIADPAYANPIIAGALLDPNVSQSAAPNRERVGFVPNTSLGDLLIRRTITNNSGRPITKLRFSVASITSLGTPGPAGQADVRLVSSTDGSVTIGGVSVPVKGLTLETGATGQPALPLGGGLGSSAVLGEVSLGTPLANGASRSVVFRLQILKSGNFSVLFNFHAAPGS